VVGTGQFAQVHASCIRGSQHLDLVGFVGSHEDIGQSFSVPVFASIEQAMERVEFGKAVVVNKNASHFESVMQLMALGKDILCEKPAVTTLAQQAALDARAKSYPGTFHVVGQRKYDAWIDHLRGESIRRTFGQLVGAHLFCSFRKGDAYFSSWRANPAESGGGVLIHNAIHYLGMLNRVLGQPLEANGLLRYHDQISGYEIEAVAFIRHENDTRSTVHVGMRGGFRTTFEMQVYFERGVVRVRDGQIVEARSSGTPSDKLKLMFVRLRRFKLGTLSDQYADFLSIRSAHQGVGSYQNSRGELKIIFDLYQQNGTC